MANSKPFFKDWIIEEQEKAGNETHNLEDNIRLELEIATDKRMNRLRRSARIAEIKKQRDITEAYNAYLKSLKSVNGG